MKQIRLIILLVSFLSGTHLLFAQRKIESPEILMIEQEGDSLFSREKEMLFEVLDFEFDSCDFYNNRFLLTFSLINKTKETLFINPNYISWYDTHSLNPVSYHKQAVKPGESIRIRLESVPYSKKRMNSPGELLILYQKKELHIPMRLKQESSKVNHCVE